MKHFTRNILARVLAAAVLVAGTVALVATGSALDGPKPDPLRGVPEYNQASRYPKYSVEYVKWLHKSAERGFFAAQYQLARMYYRGDGVPRDLVRSHMWFELCGASGVFFGHSLEQEMTPEQVAEAKELARNWKPQ
jgi:hypothetical protein